jgi:hypothetical protein
LDVRQLCCLLAYYQCFAEVVRQRKAVSQMSFHPNRPGELANQFAQLLRDWLDAAKLRIQLIDPSGMQEAVPHPVPVLPRPGAVFRPDFFHLLLGKLERRRTQFHASRNYLGLEPGFNLVQGGEQFRCNRPHLR